MVAVPLLSGVTANEAAAFLDTFPMNLEPVVVDTKINKGQFKAPPGVIQKGTGPGIDRGGIAWNGVLFRVFGTSLCKISPVGSLTVLGDVGSGGPCSFDYGFDRSGKLWIFEVNTRPH